ncbi:MAG TPA: serine protease [Oligoflexia bacterium]|nr:serine protease [Oligoflexia bacterium]HMR25133.1 serine protease [Oligoflexia bacterium]
MAINILKTNIYKYTFVVIFYLFCKSYAKDYVYSLQDYFMHGQELVEEYLQSSEQGEQIKSLVQRYSNSCVQIEVPKNENGKTMVTMGGAVIVAKGMLLLSSGHNFLGVNKKNPIKVLGPKGESKKAYLMQMDYNPQENTDWAILQVEGNGFHPQYAVELSRSIKMNAMAVVLGYPQSYGKDEDGQVVHTKAYPGQRLDPLVLLTKISHKDQGRKVVLDLEGGAFFLPGASGGPVFDIEGGLMGQYTSFITVVGRGQTTGKASMRPFPKALVKILNP